MSQVKRIPLKTILPDLVLDAHSPLGHKTFESAQVTALESKKMTSNKGSVSQLEKEASVNVKAPVWVTSVCYSSPFDSYKCLVGFNNGRVALCFLDGYNWKLLKDLEVSKAAITAIDFSKDGAYVLLEDSNKKSFGFKVLPNTLNPIPLLELQKSNPVWTNGSIYSAWSVGFVFMSVDGVPLPDVALERQDSYMSDEVR